MPRVLSKVVTSVKVLVLSLIEYFDELFLYAVRATTSCEPGTRRYPSGPGYDMKTEISLTANAERPKSKTDRVDNFSEPNLHGTRLDLLMPRRMVDQF